MLGIFTLLGMLVTALFVSNALLRDFELGTAELIFASPVKRRDYLAGRIAAALATGLLFYLLVAFGLWLAPFMPWVDAERMGPISWQGYAWSFAVIVIPNLLFTTALLSLLAAVPFDPVGLHRAGGLPGAVRRQRGGAARHRQHLAGGAQRAFGHARPVAHDPLLVHRRAQQRRSRPGRLPAGQPRAVAGRDGAAVRRHVRPVPHRAQRQRPSSLGRRHAAGCRRRSASAHPHPLPRVVPAFSASTAWQQFLRQVRFDTRGVLRSVPFIVLLVLGMANSCPTRCSGRPCTAPRSGRSPRR